MIFNEFKELVIAECAERGVAQYELYYQSAASTSVDTFQHSINGFTSSLSGGVCFRCIWHDKMGYASTENLSDEQAKAVVAKAIDNAENLEAVETVFLGEGGQEYEPLEDRSYPLPTTEELIAKTLETTEKIYASDSMVVDGSQTEGVVESGEVAIYNSKGLDLYHKSALSGLVVAGVVSDGKDMSNEYAVKLGKLDTIDTDKLIAKVVSAAKEKLGGDVAPTGQYPVIFSPDAMCSLLGAYASVFSSEAAQKGLSQLAGKEGETIAASVVTLVDDPFHKENPDPINFDAEGSPTHRKNVIDGGVLNTLLYNLKTAAVAGKKTTGNASKAGYDSPVGIRPFTMYIESGKMTEQELFAKAENGVYINDLGGLHAGANTISGDFSLQSSGYMIENGKKTTYVKSFTVAGNFYDLLKNVSAIADNLEFPGMGSMGSPSVLVEGLSVAGK